MEKPNLLTPICRALASGLQSHSDCLHDPVGFGRNFQDVPVVFHIVQVQRPALAVF